MTPRASSSRLALESCTLQLHTWRPFQIQTLAVETSKPYHLHAKKHCRSDRSTDPGTAADGLDLSRLSLLEDPPPPREGLRCIVRKRRRQGSRSISGRSSDRSGRRRRGGGGGASATYATCSDFPLATGGTDSSGELFANGDWSWGSDASEARASRREAREVGGGGGGGGMERESSGSGTYLGGVTGFLDSQGNESGYGSEPGYRGDAEFGYGDEFDEEDDDGRPMFWGPRFGGDTEQQMEIVGENKFSEQKSHHRCRRKKPEWRIIHPLRH